MCKSVVYYRVSTSKQGEVGLGIQAQKEIVTRYLETVNTKVLTEYVEVASAKSDKREELQKAMTHARATNSKLVVAKLDRLSRDMAFVAALAKDDSIELVVAESPNMSSLELYLKAMIADEERKLISSRTKQALSALKANGKVLGNPNIDKVRNTDVSAATKARIANADRYASHLRDALELAEKETSGGSLRAIAAWLNGNDFETRQGKEFTATSVNRLKARLAMQ